MLAQNTGESPLYRQFTREGSAIRIWFDHAGKALKVRGNGPISGFQIAGSDRKYVAAVARIEGTTVVVSSPEVTDPRSVRWSAGQVRGPRTLPVKVLETAEAN